MVNAKCPVFLYICLVTILASALTAIAEPANEGEWEPLQTLPWRPVHAIVLQTGNVLIYASDSLSPMLWVPEDGSLLPVPNFGYNAFCNGHVQTWDGRVFFTGGTVDDLNNVGLPNADFYDPTTNTFSAVPDMNAGRWYPTQVAMPNGDVVTISGDINPGVRNLIPEVWEAATSSWRDLPDASLFLPLYPASFLAPNGKVFVATNPSRYLDLTGSGQWSYVAPRLDFGRDDYGSACMFDNGKILYTGGGVPPFASGEMIDLNTTTPTWSYIADMPEVRRQHNTTLLPDGRVLVTGGSSSEGFNINDGPKPAIVWNPEADQWTTWAIEDEFRGYHSSSVLLPDGRIASIGGDGHPSLQVFKPPYLFQGPRPLITSVPAVVRLGDSFFVETPDAEAILAGQVNWLRPSAVTHSKNMNQRINKLTFTAATGGLLVDTPADGNLAPPGDYMLFLINDQGVPSVASWMRLALTAPVAGLLESWQFDIDGRSSTGTNDAELLGGATTIVDSERGEVLSCDGIDDTATFANQFTESFSWLGWIRTSEASDSGTDAWQGSALISALVAGTANDFVLSILNNKLAFSAGDSGITIVGTTNLNDGIWHHVAVTVDATNVTLYVDGIEDGTGEGSQTLLDANPIASFCANPVDGRHYSGLLDAAQQYDRALTEPEVLQLATVGGGTNPLLIEDIQTTPVSKDAPIQYNASASGGANLQYRWIFGDGSPETELSDSPAISHTFTAPGLYALTLTVTSASGEVVVERFWQAVHEPLTNDSPTRSSSLLYETRQGGDRLWNVNPDNDSVSVFDITSHTQLAEIPVGDNPRSIAQAPDGRVWVTNKSTATISVLDPDNLSLVDTYSLPARSQPHGLVFDPVGSRAYVALEATGILLKLGASQGEFVGSINLGASIRHVSVTADSQRVLVSRFITPKIPGEHTETPLTELGGEFFGGEVLVVDGSSMALLNTVILKHSEHDEGNGHGHDHNGHESARGIPNYLGAAAISPDGLTAWIPSKQDNIKRGMLREGTMLSHDVTLRAISSRVTLAQGAGLEFEQSALRVDHDNGAMPSASAFGPFGNYLFVALEGSQTVRVVNAYEGTEVNNFNVGRAPQGLVVSPDGSTLFVHNFMDRTVSVHDVSRIIFGNEVNVPLIATYYTVGNEALSPEVLLGKQIFYDAADPRISFESYISCAACHNDGDHDGRIWDFTQFGEGLRNTIDLRGKGDHGPSHWTGNFDEVQDFEGQIRTLGLGTGLMTDAQFDATVEPLGNPKAGLSPELDALAAYVASLTTAPPSPLRSANGALSTLAEAGKQLFEQAECTSCHSSERFTDSSLGVLHDLPTIKPSSGQRLGAPLTGLDTPGLKGLWASAPYLHDGSADTVADAVAAHGLQEFTSDEMTELEAYLLQLDDTGGYQQSQTGLLVIEAEHYSALGGTAAEPWFVNSDSLASAFEAIQASSAAKTENQSTSPFAEYTANFARSGAHQVWLRVRMAHGGADSLYFSLDDQTWQVRHISGAEQDSYGRWTWLRLLQTVDVPSAGQHVLRVYRRESSVEVDKVLVTDDGDFTPTGTGPAESPRSGGSGGSTNSAPELNAIGNLQLTAGVSTSLTVIATDPDSADTLQLTLSPLPAFATFVDNGNGSAALELNPGEGEAGSYSVTFNVEDDGSPPLSDSETLTITVTVDEPVNVAPVLTSIGPQSLTAGETLLIILDASDSNPEDTLAFSASPNPDYVTLVDQNDGTAHLTLTPEEADTGTVNLTVTVTDNGEPVLTDSETVTITVLSAIGPGPFQQGSDGTIVMEAEHFGATGGTSAPPWSLISGIAEASNNEAIQAGASSNGNSSDQSTTPYVEYLLNITQADVQQGWLRVNMAHGGSDSLYVSLDDAPWQIRYLTGPEQVSYGQWVWLKLNNALSIDTPGTHTVRIYRRETNVLVDKLMLTPDTDYVPTGTGPAESLRGNENEVNHRPIFAATADQTIAEGQSQQITVTATDPDANDTLVLSILSLPAYATFTDLGNGEGTLTLNPGVGDAGSDTISVTVTDDGDPPLAATLDFDVTVTANSAPTLTLIGDQSVVEGSTLVVSISANDVDAIDTLALTITPALNFGTFNDHGDGTATWTLIPAEADAGTTSVTVTVTDDGFPNLASSETVTLTVIENVGVNTAPILNPVGDQTLLEGDVLNLLIGASDPDGDGLAFTVAPLPDYATLTDHGNGTANLTISPGLGDAGTTTVTIEASDNGEPVLTDSETVTVTIRENTAPQLSPIGSQTLVEGETLVLAISASDVDGDQLTLSASLAGYASFNDLGEGSGELVLAPVAGDAGVATITVIVTDAGYPNLSHSETLSVSVNTDGGNDAFAQEASGLLVMEAEHFHTAGGPANSEWTVVDQVVEASNTEFIRAAALSTGNSTNQATAPYVEYSTDFNQSGTHYGWIRVKMAHGGSDSLYVSLNDAPWQIRYLTGSEQIYYGEWVWLALSVPFELTASGAHTIRVYRRESYVEVDKLLLTPDAGYTPTGTGPEESARGDAGTGNQVPALSFVANQVVSKGANLTVSFSATDPDSADALAFTLSPTVPFGIFTDHGNGTASWVLTPDTEDSGTMLMTVTVSDNGTPVRSATQEFTLNVTDNNSPPVLNNIPHQSLDEGDTLVLELSATDNDAGDSLSFVIIPALSFASLNDHGDGTASWTLTPGLQDASSYDVTVTVLDSGNPGLSDSQTITVSVANSTGSYLQSTNGLLVVEGEHYDSLGGTAAPDWAVVADGSASEGSAIQAASAGRTDNQVSSPFAEYSLSFVQTGSHEVWLRVLMLHGGADSMFFSIDEQPWQVRHLSGAEQGNYGSYVWLQLLSPVSIDATGAHVIRIYRRESSVSVDKIVLTPDTGFIPADFGPAESLRTNQ